MTGWQDWLRLLIALVIIIGFFDMLLPANDIKKFVKLVAGLVLMLAVLQPVLAIVYLNWDDNVDYLAALTNQQDMNINIEFITSQLNEAGLKPAIKVIEDSAQTQLKTFISSYSEFTNVVVGLTVTNHGEIQAVRVDGVTVEVAPLSAQQSKLTKNIADYLQIPENRIYVTLKYQQEEMDYAR